MSEPRKALLALAIMAGAVVGAQAVFRVASAPLREVLRLPGLDMPATPPPARPPAAPAPPAPPVPPPPAPSLPEGGIFGRVIAGGEPVQGVEIDVRLDDPAAPPQHARTGEDGSYRVPFLLPGRTYRVLVEGAEPRLVTLPSKGGDVRLDLESSHPAEQVPGPAGVGVPGPGPP
jgi:hypothetical protein